MKAIVTVIGQDQIGIISKTSRLLADHSVNILDISQTILQDCFTMIMIVDLSDMDIEFDDMAKLLKENQQDIGVTIKMQRENIFKTMHKIN